MALLVMHFPKLRILWSRSPHETLKIFKALKTNHEEVDVEKAIELGSNESVDALLAGDGGEEDGEENEINEAARDMLLRLPGVNVHHARKIMSACDSIADLANMSREEMKKLVGPVTGQKLFTFFRQKLGST
jgi:DNA excision repair protein ERCC-4